MSAADWILEKLSDECSTARDGLNNHAAHADARCVSRTIEACTDAIIRALFVVVSK